MLTRRTVSPLLFLSLCLAVASTLAEAQTVGLQQPTTIDTGAGLVRIRPPAGWAVLKPAVFGMEPSLGDLDGNGARATLVATRLPLRPGAVESMLAKHREECERRLKAREIFSVTEKSVGGVPGFAVVAGHRLPLQKGYVWTGFGPSGVYTFSFWCEPPFFDDYLATFQATLDSAKFERLQ
ncbi:MAG: hypothetical protein HY815_28900 [Candidatus Riflebacteria bacterium]|nr:hypothetical protein [Candidatus Riflebacteria bacterium]